LKVLVATSEAVPFAKTGGLGDVCGTLPVELARLGHGVSVVMPLYRCARYVGFPIEPLGIGFIVPVGTKTVAGKLAQSFVPGSNVPVFFIQQDQYFDRDGLYTESGEDYPDNCERFVFFCRAALEAIRLLELKPDVLHCNDWQTGLIPTYLRLEYERLARYRQIATLFTIHNISYQGLFWHWDMELTGLPWKHFNWQELEFYGKLSFLKAGLVYADAINTVSPRYAEEIQTPEFGFGMEGVLRNRREVVFGVLNGIDSSVWNPATDGLIPANYDCSTFEQGKAVCKAELLRQMGLPPIAQAPVVAFVGRLIEQKGSDLLAELIRSWAPDRAVRWVVLGTGTANLEKEFINLARLWPEKVSVRIEFSEPLAHLLTAGADIFVMPSRFEPCGLSQMHALRYGTVPLVRATGGLADTIVDCTPENLAAGTANGFAFSEPTVEAFNQAMRRAEECFQNREIWRKLITVGMQQDWSWRRSAHEYSKLYEFVVRRRLNALERQCP